MDNPRPEKVAVVDEVREKFDEADAAILTEYRGLTVAELAELRRELTAAGGDYKVYKNTLVRLAVADTPRAGVSDLLTGPTAIAFVQGDVSAVAKALRVNLPFGNAWEYVRTVLAASADGRNSMTIDLEARMRTEVDQINGAIVAAGRRVGVPTPYNDAVWRLVKAKERAPRE